MTAPLTSPPPCTVMLGLKWITMPAPAAAIPPAVRPPRPPPPWAAVAVALAIAAAARLAKGPVRWMPMAAPSAMLSPNPMKTRLGDLMPRVLVNQPLMLFPNETMLSRAAVSLALMPPTKPSISMDPKSVKFFGRLTPK